MTRDVLVRFLSSKLTTGGDENIRERFILFTRFDILDGADDGFAIDDGAESDMLLVEMGCLFPGERWCGYIKAIFF
jgi:hypothetical protein